MHTVLRFVHFLVPIRNSLLCFCRVKRRSTLSITTWVSELCTIETKSLILLALLVLRLRPIGIVYWLLSTLLKFLTCHGSYKLPSFVSFLSLDSVLHEYKEWDEKDPQLTTCNKDTKNLIQSNTVPQEVEEGKEIVFTYDVAFKVAYFTYESLLLALCKHIMTFPICRRVKSNGLLGGTPTCLWTMIKSTGFQS